MATLFSVHQLLKKAYVTVKVEFRVNKISMSETHVTDPMGKGFVWYGSCLD